MAHSPKREPFDERVARHIRQDRNLPSEARGLGCRLETESVFVAPGVPTPIADTYVEGWAIADANAALMAAEMFDPALVGTGLTAPVDGFYSASCELGVSSVIHGGDGFNVGLIVLDSAGVFKNYVGRDRVARLFYRSNGFEFSGSTDWAEEPAGVGGVSIFAIGGVTPMAAGDLLAVSAWSFAPDPAGVDVLAGSNCALALL